MLLSILMSWENLLLLTPGTCGDASKTSNFPAMLTNKSFEFGQSIFPAEEKLKLGRTGISGT